MNTKTFIFLAAIFLSLNCPAQDFQKTFWDLNESKDTARQASLLKEWELKTPNDPELFVAYFNYYVQKAREELVEISDTKSKANSLQFTDSSGKAAGYLNTVVQYNDDIVEKGLQYINKGIAANPNRLDMRFGKIYILGETMDYAKFTSEVIKAVEYSNINKNAWLWTDNKPKADGRKFFLKAVQEYVVELYNTNDDSLLINMKQISETVLKYYPENIESLSDLSIYYILFKEYDKALEQLLIAEKLAPADYIISGNLAHVYKLKGDKANAIKYYELVIISGDDEAKEFAKGQLEELKNN